MTDPLPHTTGSLPSPTRQFLNQLRDHLAQARRRLRARNLVSPQADENTTPDAPAAAILGTELHRARHTHSRVSIRIRGGHLYHAVRVETVHRHHTRLTSDSHPGVLLPLAFIETIHHLAPQQGR